MNVETTCHMLAAQPIKLEVYWQVSLQELSYSGMYHTPLVKLKEQNHRGRTAGWTPPPS